MLFIAVSMLLSAAVDLFGKSVLAIWALCIGLIIGIAAIVFVQVKYNRK